MLFVSIRWIKTVPAFILKVEGRAKEDDRSLPGQIEQVTLCSQFEFAFRLPKVSMSSFDHYDHKNHDCGLKYSYVIPLTAQIICYVHDSVLSHTFFWVPPNTDTIANV